MEQIQCRHFTSMLCIYWNVDWNKVLALEMYQTSYNSQSNGSQYLRGMKAVQLGKCLGVSIKM